MRRLLTSSAHSTRGVATSFAAAAGPSLPSAAAAAATSTPRALSQPPVGSSLFVWGKIDEGRLGVPTSGLTFSARALALGPALGPTALTGPLLARGGVSAVACAGAKTLALAADGSLWSWGACSSGSLGHGPGEAGARVPRPRRIEALAGVRIVRVACGETASACVSDEGDVYTWGWGGSFWKGA